MAPLLARLKTKYCAAQCVMEAATSLFSSLLGERGVRCHAGDTGFERRPGRRPLVSDNASGHCQLRPPHPRGADAVDVLHDAGIGTLVEVVYVSLAPAALEHEVAGAERDETEAVGGGRLTVVRVAAADDALQSSNSKPE